MIRVFLPFNTVPIEIDGNSAAGWGATLYVYRKSTTWYQPHWYSRPVLTEDKIIAQFAPGQWTHWIEV